MEKVIQLAMAPRKLFSFHRSSMNFPASSVQAHQLLNSTGQTQLWLDKIFINPSLLCRLLERDIGHINVYLDLSIKDASGDSLPLPSQRVRITKHCANDYKGFSFLALEQTQKLASSDRQQLDRLSSTVAKDFLTNSDLWLHSHRAQVDELSLNIACCLRGALYTLLVSSLATDTQAALNYLLAEFKKSCSHKQLEPHRLALLDHNLTALFQELLSQDTEPTMLDRTLGNAQFVTTDQPAVAVC